MYYNKKQYIFKFYFQKIFRNLSKLTLGSLNNINCQKKYSWINYTKTNRNSTDERPDKSSFIEKFKFLKFDSNLTIQFYDISKPEIIILPASFFDKQKNSIYNAHFKTQTLNLEHQFPFKFYIYDKNPHTQIILSYYLKVTNKVI